MLGLALAACQLSPTACPEATPVAPASSNADGPDSNGTGYDAALADRLGADQYGMHAYVVAFLEAGPNRPTSAEQAAQLMRAHLDNINRLAKQGVLVLAGPFMDDGNLRGIYVFDVATIEEAKALTETDPAIAAGTLVMELHPWYGSAAIKELNAIHERVARENP